MRRMFSGFGFVIASLVLIATLGFFVMSVDQREVVNISVVGHLTEPQLQNVKQLLEEMDLAASDTVDVQQRLMAMDWVRHANVRKIWPDGVSVEVEPEQVIAYWNDNGFINAEGKVLVTDLLIGGDLPHLFGPEGTEVEVMAGYHQMHRLLILHDHEIQELRRTARGAWSLETRDGLEVLLGIEDHKARLERFLLVSQKLNEDGSDLVEKKPIRMDARYINGVAVHFSENETTENNELEVAEINKNVGERSL